MIKPLTVKMKLLPPIWKEFKEPSEVSKYTYSRPEIKREVRVLPKGWKSK